MARDHLLSSDQATDDEYIDMDISSATTFLCYSITTSPPHSTREFEFQMSSNPLERDSTPSPADELFYKGKLLPLHLPPRMQMVQKLLQSSSTSHEQVTSSFEENHTTPTAITTAATTPFESCNISPSDSCNVSRELYPEEYFYECAAPVDDAGFIDGHTKKSWSKKLKLIKQSTLSLKLKASRAYLRSLFSKSGCSDESCADAARSSHEFTSSKAKEYFLNKYVKVAKKNTFGQIRRERNQVAAIVSRSNAKEKMGGNEDGGTHRRSFSVAIKRHSGTKCTSSPSSSLSSSSSSTCSSSSYSFSSENSRASTGMQPLKRSSRANSEVERSIQGAIAHCKQSQQLFCTRKSVSVVGFGSLSASRIAGFENHEWPGMCRG